jgi:hypothetical protein
MLGGSKGAEPNDDGDKAREELAVERVQHDYERDRDEATERRIETPTSLED